MTLTDELRLYADTETGACQKDLLIRAASTIEGLHRTNRKKCIVKGCPNHSDEGRFEGEMCMPCYNMITTGEYSRGNTVFHHAEHERQLLKQALRKIREVADFGLGDV